jgi:transposase-like protein
MEMLKKGNVSKAHLEKLYTGYIEKGSTVVTDSCRSYTPLCRSMSLKHKKILSGKHSNGVFNLAHINSLHSRFKDFIKGFSGVSTKHFSNYLVWFKWLERTKTLKDVVRPTHIVE